MERIPESQLLSSRTLKGKFHVYTCIILNLIDCKKYKINLQVIEKNHQKRNLEEKQNYLKLL